MEKRFSRYLKKTDKALDNRDFEHKLKGLQKTAGPFF